MSAAIPFFSDLPPKAMTAACRLWDAIQAPGYNGVQAYTDFCHDLTLAGLQPPARGVVKRWVAGVQAGQFERPVPRSPAAILAEMSSPTNVGPEVKVAPVYPRGNSTHKPSAPKVPGPRKSHNQINSPPTVEAETAVRSEDDAFETLIARMVEDLERELERIVRAEARKRVSRRLRKAADVLDGVAA